MYTPPSSSSSADYDEHDHDDVDDDDDDGGDGVYKRRDTCQIIDAIVRLDCPDMEQAANAGEHSLAQERANMRAHLLRRVRHAVAEALQEFPNTVVWKLREVVESKVGVNCER